MPSRPRVAAEPGDADMKLLYTPIRGYVHTVEAVIRYAGLEDRVEAIATKPFDPATPLVAINPLGKVPTLLLDDGEYLAGGPVIYEYLDTLHRRRKLYPARGRARFATLRQTWMADGLFDTFVLLIIESWLPPAQQRSDYIARCWGKFVAILNQMERDAGSYGRLDIAQVRGVGALQFLRLKMAQVGSAAVGLDPAYDVLAGRPALAQWFTRIERAPMFHSPLIRLE
jgi:glutathione S-transferase